MGASGSTGPDRHNGNAGSGERPGHRVRRVRVTGAGLPQVNGVYLPTADFAGGEAFQLEVNKDSIKKIYIRCRSDHVRDAWVITMSSNSDVSGGNLYKRECESQEQITPPLFGWKPCAASDGLPGSLATQVVQGVPKLKYYYGPLEEINWDCQPPSPAQLHKPKATREMPPRQEGISSSLTVCVIGANNIPSTRAREFHVACQVPGKNQTIESVAVPAGQDPEFRLKTPFQSWRRPDDLQFTLYAERDIKIGVASLDYEYFSESGFVGEIPVTLFGSDSQEVTMSVCVALPGQVTPGVDVEIRKDHGSKIGIEIAPDTQSSALTVTKILEGGLISQWNYDNPDQQVRTRDKITEIDGIRGSCLTLLAKFADDEPRTIRMRTQRAGT